MPRYLHLLKPTNRTIKPYFSVVGFSPLMNIDKLIQRNTNGITGNSFSPLMNIDKLILLDLLILYPFRFSPLMNIDKLIPGA